MKAKRQYTREELEREIESLEDDIRVLEETIGDKEDTLAELQEQLELMDSREPEEIEADEAYKRGMLRLTKYYGKVPQSIADMQWWKVPLYP